MKSPVSGIGALSNIIGVASSAITYSSLGIEENDTILDVMGSVDSGKVERHHSKGVDNVGARGGGGSPPPPPPPQIFTS